MIKDTRFSLQLQFLVGHFPESDDGREGQNKGRGPHPDGLCWKASREFEVRPVRGFTKTERKPDRKRFLLSLLKGFLNLRTEGTFWCPMVGAAGQAGRAGQIFERRAAGRPSPAAHLCARGRLCRAGRQREPRTNARVRIRSPH